MYCRPTRPARRARSSARDQPPRRCLSALEAGQIAQCPHERRDPPRRLRRPAPPRGRLQPRQPGTTQLGQVDDDLPAVLRIRQPVGQRRVDPAVHEAYQRGRGNTNYTMVAKWAKKHLGSGAVVADGVHDRLRQMAEAYPAQR
jgi:hypothetical protein